MKLSKQRDEEIRALRDRIDQLTKERTTTVPLTATSTAAKDIKVNYSLHKLRKSMVSESQDKLAPISNTPTVTNQTLAANPLHSVRVLPSETSIVSMGKIIQ